VGDVTAQPPGTPVPLDTLLAHREWVRALARSLVHDEHRADDVEQETWRMALERPPRHAASLRAWFGTVVRNAARGAGRRAASRARFESMAVTRAGVPSPDEVVAEAEVQHRLVEAVLALDEPYRTAVLLRWFQGLETSEIAARCGEPVETVRTRLKRAVERLRRRMEVELGDDRDAWLLLLWGHCAPPKPTGTGAPPLSAAGGLAMGAATKVSAAAAAAIVLAALAWTVTRSGSESTVPTAASGTSDAHAGPHTPRIRAVAAAADAAPAPSASPDGAVDLASADRDLDLCGVVVDSDGKPVAGAGLTVVSHPWRRLMLLTADGYFETRDGASTKSAVDGSFLVRLTRGQSAALRVRAEGFAVATFVSLQAGERTRLVLARAVRLVVHAKDEADRPVADAVVDANCYGLGAADGFEFRAGARTGADGTAVLEGLPAGRTVSITVDHAGLARCRLRPAMPATGERDVTAILVAGTTVTGRVTDAVTGHAIAGARVAFDWTMERSVTSDAEGRYEFAGHVGADGTTVHATAPGYARARQSIDAAKETDIALSPGDAIVGRVVDPHGAPVARALVSAIASRDHGDAQITSTSSGTSGDDGRFRLPDLRRDLAHGLVVTADGHGRSAQEVPASATTDAARDVGDVVLPDPRTIEVRLIGTDGRPLVRHRVDLWAERLEASDDYGSREMRWSDDLGRVRFPDLGPGAFQVRLEEPAETWVTRSVKVGERDPEPVVISFESDRAIRVRVVDDSGAPLSGFRVQVEFDGAPPQGKLVGEDGVAEVGCRAQPERILLFGTTDTTRTEFVAPAPPPIARGQTEWTVVVHRAAPISGKVLDPSGGPLANAMVNARRGLGLVGYATSAKDGTFRMAVPAGENVDLVLQQVFPNRDDLPQLAGEVRGVAPGTQGVVFATRACVHDRTLRVRVEDPEGSPVAGVLVMALAQGARQFDRAVTDAAGVAALEKLADAQTFLHVDMAAQGQYAWTARWARARGMSVFPEGQEVTMRLLAAVHLRGKVLDADGKPAAGAYVDALAEGFAANGKSSETGEFDLLVPADETGGFQIMARLHEGRREVGSANRYGVHPGDGEIVIRLVAQ
jgi:RNA polymerase sigma-70 factor (ECF subfamily)